MNIYVYIATTILPLSILFHLISNKISFSFFYNISNLQLAFDKKNIKIVQLLIQNVICNESFNNQNIAFVQRILANYGINTTINKENNDIAIPLIGDIMKTWFKK